MGRILAHAFGYSAAAGTAYGVSQGIHTKINSAINQASNGGLDAIVNGFNSYVPLGWAVAWAPYLLPAYIASALIYRFIANRRFSFSRQQAAAPQR